MTSKLFEKPAAVLYCLLGELLYIFCAIFFVVSRLHLITFHLLVVHYIHALSDIVTSLGDF